MPTARSASFAMALFTAGLLVTGCTGPAASPVRSDTEPSASVPTTAPTIEPSVGVSSSEPLATEPSMPEPPAALLAVEGGDPVVGQLGSFTWENGGSDSPWLPGAPIRVGVGERLVLTLASPIDVADWTVSRAPELDGSGEVGVAQGSGAPVAFPAPPAGTWSVYVSIRFADNLGDAAYFWLIEVD